MLSDGIVSEEHVEVTNQKRSTMVSHTGLEVRSGFRDRDCPVSVRWDVFR